MQKAKVRIAIMAKVSGSTWGLGAGMLRLSWKYLALRLFRYGLAVTGSGLQERHLKELDTCILNVLARGIAGVGPSARLPILHMVSSALTVRNLYTHHCGEVLNLSLRAPGNSVRTR